jgi:putative peptidoglycan lipid II flippase
MFFTIISKVLGLVREMVLAAQFGTNWRLDALIIAMDPALQISTIISSAMATMIIPIYIDIKSKKDSLLLKQYTTKIVFLSSFLLILFGFFLMIFPEFFIKLFAPNFEGKELAYAISKLKYVGILPLVNGINILFTALLKAEKTYLAYSLTQLIYNIIAIPVIICFAPFFSESSYLLAYLCGTLAMDLFLLILVRKHFKLSSLFKRSSNTSVRKTLFLAAPLMLSGSLSIINNIVDKAFASSLSAGSISAMRFAQTIRAMITSIIVGSLMATIFTELSEASSRNDMKALTFRLNKTSTDLFNLLIPLTSWLVIVAQPIISLLFQRGAFTSDSTKLVSSAFLGYSFIIVIGPIYILH